MLKTVLVIASPALCGLIGAIVAQVCYMMNYQDYIWDSYADRHKDLYTVAMRAYFICAFVGMIIFYRIMIMWPYLYKHYMYLYNCLL